MIDFDQVVKEWITPIVENPNQDHHFTIYIKDVDDFVQITSSALKACYELDSGKEVELFKGMVGAECKGCGGATTGEQIQMIGVYQQSAGFSSASDFYISLVGGNCPKCSNETFNMKWIGENW